MIYFVSDYHFEHENIIKYSSRPFNTVQDMNLYLVQKTNEVVKPEDEIRFGGDFVFGKNKLESSRYWLSKINCKNFHWCFGNHDNREAVEQLKSEGLIKSCYDYLELKIPNHCGITLMHYAMRVWNKSHHNTWNLYGHSHGTLPDDVNSRSLDVGADTCLYGHERFTPYSLAELDNIMRNHKQYKPVDHHNNETK